MAADRAPRHRQRSLVLSEPSLPVPGLRPGEHYIEVPLHEFSDRIDWLLTTAAGQAHAEAVRQAGYAACGRSSICLRSSRTGGGPSGQQVMIQTSQRY